jgi:hypothetical protein
MGTFTNNHDEMGQLKHFCEKSFQCQDQVMEYLALCMADILTEPQADRLGNILEEASSNPLLSFWIDEVDHVIAHRKDLIDAEYVEKQQAALRKKIRTFSEIEALVFNLKASIRQVRDVMDNLHNQAADPAFVESLQECLKKEGVYDGSVDGEFGQYTQQALEKLEGAMLR